MPSLPHPYLPPQGETYTLQGGSQDLEGDTDGIRIPDSQVDTSGVFYFLLDGPVQEALYTTTLLMSDKFKEDCTA